MTRLKDQTFRIEPKKKSQLQKLVKKGKAETVSQAIRSGIDLWIKKNG